MQFLLLKYGSMQVYQQRKTRMFVTGISFVVCTFYQKGNSHVIVVTYVTYFAIFYN